MKLNADWGSHRGCMYEIADGGVFIIDNFPLPFLLKSESKFKFSECWQI